MSKRFARRLDSYFRLSEHNTNVRTEILAGLTSLTTSILFLVAIILAPVMGITPSAATAPALIFVGILMLSSVKDVDLSDMEKAMPAFCTIVFMPSPTASPWASSPTA